MSGATGMTDVDTLLTLARYSNIYAKLTFAKPMGTVEWGDAKPLVRQVMDHFGSGRCVSASNFCGEPQSTYDASMQLIVNDFPYQSEEEKMDVCGRTACKLWRWRSRTGSRL